MMADDNAIREVSAWLVLTGLLRDIRDILESPEDISVDVTKRTGVAKGFDFTRSATLAIHRVETLCHATLWKASLLVDALPQSELRDDIGTALGMCGDAIRQAYVPADSARSDDNEEEAIRICEEAIARAAEWCGGAFRILPARPVEWKFYRSEKFTDAEYVQAIGMTWSKFSKSDPLDLEPVLNCWTLNGDQKAITTGKVPRLGAETTEFPRDDLPNDPETRALVLAVRDGLARGQTVADINRSFFEDRPTLTKSVQASMKRNERLYRNKLESEQSAE